DLDYKLPIEKDQCLSFSFEITTPLNQIVVQHKESSLHLIGVRNLSTQYEMNPVVEAHHNGWKCIDPLMFKSQEEVEKHLVDMNGSEQEGFVIVDDRYRRIKFKCCDYVKKHRLVSSMSQRNMLDAVRTNEGDEILLYAPQFEKLFWEIKCRYEKLTGQIEGFYEAIKHIDDKKKFALLAKDQKFSGVLFGLKHGKTDSIKQYLADMNIKALEQWLGMKSIEL
ncbi:hypothetical protein LCGC14_2333150, partial [marine sediment metagenome]